MSFAAQLKKLRNEAGLTQFELAERVSVSYESIQRYEQGRHVPKPIVAAKIAQHFGLTVEQLLSVKT